jgi:starch synthase
LEGMGTSILLAKVERSSEENIEQVQAAAFKRLREAHSRGRMFHYNCLLQDLIAKISSQTNVYQFVSG